MKNIYNCILILTILLVVHQLTIRQLIVAARSQNFEIVSNYISFNFWFSILLLTMSSYMFVSTLRNLQTKLSMLFFIIECAFIFVFVVSAKLWYNIIINFDNIANYSIYIQKSTFCILVSQFVLILIFRNNSNKLKLFIQWLFEFFGNWAWITHSSASFHRHFYFSF